MATATAKKSTGRSPARRRYRIWMTFIVLFMGWAAYTLFGQMQQQKATNVKLTTIESGLEASKLQTEALKREVERLNDPEYISQLATKEQGMVKQGEQQIFSK
ncbi:septum formation initiator family protein [Paenibacillus sp. GSMTC-2017]|uniref:FtsB family cell division protein n=1 Tax=Paenibacillus sp. GSMTC-2017 TaxID=2794350 RepID=UPI0018D64CAD|nr:septum formation initiator family protein [Paenibacillus sp. GSMTC-2017]MBH5320712.1 septum formation initiator family protein [Paenibacillus sp. GSMTC-2017]